MSIDNNEENFEKLDLKISPGSDLETHMQKQAKKKT